MNLPCRITTASFSFKLSVSNKKSRLSETLSESNRWEEGLDLISQITIQQILPTVDTINKLQLKVVQS